MPPFSRRSKRGARPPRTPAKEVDETGEEAPRCVTPRASIPIDAVTSPSPSLIRPLRTLLDSPGTSVLSPFATFASSMPNLTSPLGKRSAGGEPASPFTGFASQLPNLSASPGVSLMACGANIATPGKFPGSWALSIDATFASRPLLSPGNFNEPPCKVRRSLMGNESSPHPTRSAFSPSGGSSIPNSVTGTPSVSGTPRMHVMCFGETGVTTSSTPTDLVGTFGQFTAGLDSGGKSVVYGSAPRDGARSRQKRPNSRRSLDHGIALADEREDCASSSERGAKRELDSSPMGLSSGPPSAIKREAESEEEDGENRRLSMLSSKSTPPAAPSRQAPSKSNAKRAKEAPAPAEKKATAKELEAAAQLAAQTAARKVPRDPSKLCKCKKSKCVRQYCICFRAGLLCEGCDCAECLNDGKHEEERLAAIDHIKTSDPLAFVEKIRPDGTEIALEESKIHVRGCRCKNSKCLKKYCECFEHGVTCTSRCDCKDCLNGKPTGGEAAGKKGKAPVAVAVAVQVQQRPASAASFKTKALAPPAHAEQARPASVGDSPGWGTRSAMKAQPLAGAPQTPHREQLGSKLHVPLTPADPHQVASALLDFSKVSGVPASCSPLSASKVQPGRSPLRSPGRRMQDLSPSSTSSPNFLVDAESAGLAV
mmetsp:Transcript_72318/g.165693  ORF Transcript_72318/g.165693 Transcript_72318/m.165693 type:complete len:653 (+) Transcript_72318:3-1961(+)